MLRQLAASAATLFQEEEGGEDRWVCVCARSWPLKCKLLAAGSGGQYWRTWSAKTDVFGTSDESDQRRRVVAHTESFPTSPKSEFSKVTSRSCNYTNCSIHLEKCIRANWAYWA